MKVDNTDIRSRYYVRLHEEWKDDADSEWRRRCPLVLKLDPTGGKKERFGKFRKQNSE
jgi:hypothetical protein